MFAIAHISTVEPLFTHIHSIRNSFQERCGRVALAAPRMMTRYLPAVVTYAVITNARSVTDVAEINDHEARRLARCVGLRKCEKN